jgi:hypothetical protein
MLHDDIVTINSLLSNKCIGCKHGLQQWLTGFKVSIHTKKNLGLWAWLKWQALNSIPGSGKKKRGRGGRISPHYIISNIIFPLKQVFSEKEKEH